MGYEVIAFNSIKKAISYLIENSNKINVIIVNIDSCEECKLIFSAIWQINENIPIINMNSTINACENLNCFPNHLIGYLKKPFIENELAEIIEKLVTLNS